MKHILNSIILLFSILAVSSESYSQNVFPALTGAYLGQELPGLTPKVFAPGYVALGIGTIVGPSPPI